MRALLSLFLSSVLLPVSVIGLTPLDEGSWGSLYGCCIEKLNIIRIFGRCEWIFVSVYIRGTLSKNRSLFLVLNGYEKGRLFHLTFGWVLFRKKQTLISSYNKQKDWRIFSPFCWAISRYFVGIYKMLNANGWINLIFLNLSIENIFIFQKRKKN